MDKRWKEGGNGKRALDGLDSEPSVSPFRLEREDLSQGLKGSAAIVKPAIFHTVQ